MRVHITLHKDLLEDEHRREETLSDLAHLGFRQESRQPLGGRFGIYRGDIDTDTQIPLLEGVAGVVKVEADETKRILEE